MISAEDIEQRRTSEELKLFVEGVRERCEVDRDELLRARRGEGLYRAFFDEVLPLSLFAHLLYPPDTSFLPVLGNQGFDVEVFDGSGCPIDKIEIAKPRDGHAEAQDNALIEERGFGRTRVYDFGGQLEELVPWVAKTAENKSLKDYRDCTLVFVAATDPAFDQELPALEQRCAELVEKLRKMEFRAKRAFLAVPALNRCYAIDG